MRVICTRRWSLVRALTLICMFFVVSPLVMSSSAAQGVACVVSEGVVQEGDIITGTSGNDVIDCTAATTDKSITGGDGNDTITGGLGNDYIDGGSGNDTITGGPANDCLYGQEGNDTLTGSAGSNTIDPGAGENTVSDNTDPNGEITGCTTSTTPLPTETSVPTTVPLPTEAIQPTSEPLPTGVVTAVPPADGTVTPTVDSTTTPTAEPVGGLTLVAVAIYSPSITGGETTDATVRLSAPAPDGGVIVLLSSDSPSMGVAESVYVQVGDTTAVFEIGTTIVTEPTHGTITATLNDTSVSATLELVGGGLVPAPAETAVVVQASSAATSGQAGAVVTGLPSTGTLGDSGTGSSTVMLLATVVAVFALASAIRLGNRHEIRGRTAHGLHGDGIQRLFGSLDR